MFSNISGLPEDYKARGEKLANGKYAKKMQQNSYINRRLQVIDGKKFLFLLNLPKIVDVFISVSLSFFRNFLKSV